MLTWSPPTMRGFGEAMDAPVSATKLPCARFSRTSRERPRTHARGYPRHGFQPFPPIGRVPGLGRWWSARTTSASWPTSATASTVSCRTRGTRDGRGLGPGNVDRRALARAMGGSATVDSSGDQHDIARLGAPARTTVYALIDRCTWRYEVVRSPGASHTAPMPFSRRDAWYVGLVVAHATSACESVK